MTKVLVTRASLEDTADSIRSKLGVQTTYKPSQFADAIDAITGGVSSADNGKVVVNGVLTAQTSKSVTTNGTYDTTTNNEVTVNVSSDDGTTPALPSPYKQALYVRNCDSISGSHTRYLDTGIPFENITRVELAYSVYGINGDWAWIFGARYSKTNTIAQAIGAMLYVGSGTKYLRLCYGNTETDDDAKKQETITSSSQYYVTKIVIYVDDNTGKAKYTVRNSNGWNMSGTLGTPVDLPQVNISLCACQALTSDNTIEQQNSVPLNIYCARIWVDEQLAFDGIPCVDGNGNPGLYDLIGGSFKGFSGSSLTSISGDKYAGKPVMYTY